jgi:dipeptidyl aminopeptidase/acylaminoacyl peptidase
MMKTMAVAVLCAVAGVASAAGPASPPPVLDFVKKPRFEAAKISPTGRYLAVTIPYGDQTSLGILDVQGLKVTGTLRFTHGEHVHGFHWVGPERVVVEVATRGGPLDQPRLTGELYAMNADGSDKKYLYGYRGSEQIGSRIGAATKAYGLAWVVDPMLHDPRTALIVVVPWDKVGRGDPLIERIDVHTGERRNAGTLPGFRPVVVADRQGRPRFVASMDADRREQLFAAADVPGGWQRVEPPGGLASVVLHSTTPDGQSVFLTTEDAAGRSCLREYRFAGGFAELACVEGDNVGDPILAFDDDRPIGVLRGAGAPQAVYFDEKHPDARLLLSLQKAFGGQRIRVTSRTLDNQTLVVEVDGDRNPGDFYLVNRQTKKAEYLVSRRDWIDPAAMTPVQAIRYRTRDGATIHGYLTVRGGDKARKQPLVLMPHGGPHGLWDAWAFDPWAQLLASRGYAVLQPNYRGSGGYGKAHEEAGYRKWGTLMQDDLTDAVRWAVEAGIADGSRVCIFGASYGGYAALMSPLREPDLYRCAVSFAGVYDLVEQASDSDTADHVLGRKYLERVLGDKDLMREQSPVTHIARLKAPVLIAHGTSDKRVPFSQAKLLRKALDQHQKPYVWLEYRGEEHGLHDEANAAAFLTRALEFLDTHLRAATAAPATAQTQ